MQAFRYINGTLARCLDYGPVMRVALPRPPIPLTAPAPPTRRERRRLARRGSGRRRQNARTIHPCAVPMIDAAMETAVLLAHPLRWPAYGEALLYLPEREAVEARHLRDVERAVLG